MSNIPVRLFVRNNEVAVYVGRKHTPLFDADPGVQASFEQALTDYDGSESGPLTSGIYLLDQTTNRLSHKKS